MQTKILEHRPRDPLDPDIRVHISILALLGFGASQVSTRSPCA